MGVVGVFDHLPLQPIFYLSPGDSELGNPVDDVNGQVETIDLVLDGQLQGRVDIAFLLVAANL